MIDNQQKKHCIVIGGGTAGWLSACYLQSALKDQVKVSIVDPENGNTIGVGESTLPTIHKTLKVLNIPLQKFILETNASLKQGITFQNWLKDQDIFYHPYDLPKSIESRSSSFLKWYQCGHNISFADFSSSQPAAIRNKKSPFSVGADGSLIQQYTYSLHVDASEITRFLKTHSQKIKITHYKSKVSQIKRKKELITEIRLEDGTSLACDLYIDCSGFQRILCEKENIYEKFDFLPSDMAITTCVPHDQTAISPTTIASAHSAGWIWDIPLYSRRGVGCVFSQSHMDVEEAYATFEKYLNQKIDTNNLKIIPFKAGNLARPWDGNVVNIGLSSGFIEPLESTGIYFIEAALDLLASTFPLNGQEWARKKFNKEMRERYQECADFVYLHYLLSDRDDSSFWNEFKDSINIPSHIKELLDFWRGTPPSHNHFTNGRQIFGLPAHEYILYGMNFIPDTFLKLKNLSQAKHHPKYVDSPLNLQNNNVEQLLNHNDFLDVVHGAKSPEQIHKKYNKQG